MNSQSQDASTLRTTRFHRESLAFAGALASLGTMAAQAAPARQEDPANEKPPKLDQLVVDADPGTLYNPQRLSSPKYQQPLRDQPRTQAIIPKEVIRDQNANTLRDILRNTPGISIEAGEGHTRPPGDNLYIRGFHAGTDIFVDGVRDFGSYSRDSFNIEQVEISKGPGSTDTGRSSTGGTVNLASKKPGLNRRYELMLGGGSDNYYRGTLDLNQPLDFLPGAALRLNLMYHDADTPGRDHVFERRWGVAPSLAFGLDTDTRVILSYFYQGADSMPDFGLPFVKGANTPGVVGHLPPVPYSNFYGLLARDFLKTQTHLATLEIEHDFSSALSLHNLTRFGWSSIEMDATGPRFLKSGGVYGTAIDRSSADGWKFRDRIDSLWANQTTLRYGFDTGGWQHQLVAGLDLARETARSYERTDANLAPPTELFFPNPHTPYLPLIHRNGQGVEVEARSVGAYLFDTLTLAKAWLLSGGLRWDYQDVDVRENMSGSMAGLGRHDSLLSYRAALTWKPVESGSIYLAYGTSFNPSVEDLGLGKIAALRQNIRVSPEKNRSLELGTKWGLLHDRLMLTAALFSTDKTNARTIDPTDPTSTVLLVGRQRVRGVELSATGEINEWWHVMGGYTYLHSKVRNSLDPAQIGQPTLNTPEHSFNLWSVFQLPGNFQAGVGAYYAGSQMNSKGYTIPSYFVADAMLGWRANEHVSFQLNAHNLFNRRYIGQIGGSTAVPGPGRSITLSSRIRF